jgi:hypothetical protein
VVLRVGCGFAAVLCLIAALVGVRAECVSAAEVPSSDPVPFPVVNGSVRALLVDGDTAYVGGRFTSIGNMTGPLAFVGPRDGKLRRGFPILREFPDGSSEA